MSARLGRCLSDGSSQHSRPVLRAASPLLVAAGMAESHSICRGVLWCGNPFQVGKVQPIHEYLHNFAC